MFFEKVIILTKMLEDPKNPLLGPSLKALYLFGLWQTGSKFRTMVYSILHFSTILFVSSQFVELYFVRHDLNKVFDNVSLTVVSAICVAKCYSTVLWQKSWIKLVYDIAKEEIFQMKKQNFLVRRYIHGYIKYTRIVTYMYWLLVLGTIIFLIITPFVKYLSSHNYREEIKSGHEPLPQIMSSWFPFDKNKMPGYFIAIIVHIYMVIQGSGSLAAYDAMAIAIMSYLKGQMMILKHKCNSIFEEAASTEVILDNIKECHRHHTALMKHYKMFNSLLSPTMCLYLLLCSITICGSVAQFSSKHASVSQKIWVVEYTIGLVTQLFMYCWHGNEVVIQSHEIERSTYNSDWWQADVRVRKQLLLLAGKLNHPFILTVGGFTMLSVSTFVTIFSYACTQLPSWIPNFILLAHLEIMKSSYSFYTLISQINDDEVI